METPLYYLARALVALLQALPLTWVAWLGHSGGGVAYWLDARHRRVTLRNLTMCFGREKSPAELRALALENFRRIGENYACAIKTAAMSFEALRPRVEFVGDARIISPPADRKPQGVVAAIGHFGNFELYARFGQFAPAYKCATTYRGLRQPSLDRLLQSLREQSGCLFFERRFEGSALKAFMNQPGVMLGLLSDQSGGALRGPFLGHDCSTTTAPAVFALRYHCALITGICYRVGLARWRIEVGAEIPTHENGQPRSTAAIMRDVNQAFEAAVRRDPANWFWVHRRWKPANSRAGVSPAPAGVSPALEASAVRGPGGRRDACPTIPEPLPGSQNPEAGQ
jgi:KDO2-lipid IV(A) lauroyltransferase